MEQEAPNSGQSVVDWRQGDFALAVGGMLLGDKPEAAVREQIEPVWDDDVLGFVVVSQSCDITSDPLKNPNVVVAPIRSINLQTAAYASSGRVPTIILMNSLPSNSAVDLNSFMTIRKSLLAQWDRQEGLHNDDARANFARSLERKHGRFAFPDDFNRSIAKFGDKIREKYGKADSNLGQVIRSLLEIRVLPSVAWDEQNVQVTFILLLKDPKECEASADVIQEEFARILASIEWQGAFKPDNELPIMVMNLDEMSVRQYLQSAALDLNALSFAARYSKSTQDEAQAN